MDNINDIISSLSNEDIAKLQDMANSIFGEQKSSMPEPPKNQQPPSSGMPFDLGGINPAMLSTLGSLMGKAGSTNSEQSDFINALKPMLSPERQKKADEAMQLMQIFKILPLLHEQGIL